MTDRADVGELFQQQVTLALKSLLQEKTLYQSIMIDIGPIKERIRSVKGVWTPVESNYSQPLSKERIDAIAQQPLETHLATCERLAWSFDTQDSLPQGLLSTNPHHEVNTHDQLDLLLPTINVACNFCTGVLPPHNSGYLNQAKPVFNEVLCSGPPLIQIFLLPYTCQNCKEEPIFFLVHREGVKLTLTGRSRLMKVDIPRSIPKQEGVHYGDAVIANMAGKTLAGLFFLRVFVEQYMRRVTKSEGKMRGEDLGDRYALLLDDQFPKKFRSLKTIYEELSDKLHSADPSTEQFAKSVRDINLHFDQLLLLPLKNTQHPKPGA